MSSVTTPQLPSAPTPGLPPPPGRSTDRRKTFLLSQSTWSASTAPRPSHDASSEREVRRTLLLGAAYSLVYVVLWLPWMVGRVMEARHGSDGQAMAGLAGLAQYLGLMHATVFAVIEKVWGEGPGRGRRRRGVFGGDEGPVKKTLAERMGL